MFVYFWQVCINFSLSVAAKLTSIGINATLVGECQKDKGVADKIAEGAFTTVFTSPEAALTPGMWRRCFTSRFFHDNLKAIVIDEAHSQNCPNVRIFLASVHKF
jgi:ABC-type uncharacterized transport system YnjBCD ATPase subunit